MQPMIGGPVPLRTLLIASLLLLHQGCVVADDNHATNPDFTELVVYTQSIGRGVPVDAEQKFIEITKLLKSEGLNPKVQAWGIEGEQRLCVVFNQQQHVEMIKIIDGMSEGVRLLKVTYERASADPVSHCRQ